MNKKIYTIVALALLILVVSVSATLTTEETADQISSPAANNKAINTTTFAGQNGFYVTIKGKNYTMNPTILPVAVEKKSSFIYAMNPTMLPINVETEVSGNYFMNPTMLPAVVDDTSSSIQAMNPTMLPEQLLTNSAEGH